VTLRRWSERVHTLDMAHSVFGLPVGARATVLGLGDGRLALISPVRFAAADVAALRALGEVAYIVAPNRFHYRFVPDARRHFPGARVLGAPGLGAKRPALRLDAELDAERLPGIEQHLIAGMPKASEVALRVGDTLVLTDLCFNVRATDSWLYRFYLRRGGAYGRLAMTGISRRLIVDRAAFDGSRAVLLGWGCDRIIVTHGEVLDGGGAAALAEALP
jgi:hypothetical protein